MNTLKLGFRRLNIPEKINRSRTIVSKMVGNSNFSQPNPSLEDLTLAAETLEQAYTGAQDGNKADKIFVRKCETALLSHIKTLGAYVQSASKGDAQIIVDSGFDLRAGRGPAVDAANPSHVRGKATNRSGEVVIRWNHVPGARAYTVEMSTDGTNWASCGVSTRVKITVTGLESGSKPGFRVAAIGASGQSGWSDPGYVRVD